MNNRCNLVRRHTILLFTLFLFLASGENANATHITMGNFDFTCLGGDTFLVRMHLLRDCSGATMPVNLPSVSTSSASGCPSPILVEPWNRAGVKEVSRLFPDYLGQSTCQPFGFGTRFTPRLFAAR